LAIDSRNSYVVVELKVSRGYDRVVGQLLRYMAWIEKNHAEAAQPVRGFVVAREISDDLILACSRVSGITLFEYALSVQIRKVVR
jgi:RecB family endonuclease NucS